jgi:hypothetical protein
MCGPRRYQLGPNGAIVTSLNLFATKFDEVLALIDRRAPELEYVRPIHTHTYIHRHAMTAPADRHVRRPRGGHVVHRPVQARGR